MGSGQTPGLRFRFSQADGRKPGARRGSGSLWCSGSVELQQDQQEQGGHPTGRGNPSAGTPAQVPAQEHAHSSGGHAAGVCLCGEEDTDTPSVELLHSINNWAITGATSTFIFLHSEFSTSSGLQNSIPILSTFIYLVFLFFSTDALLIKQHILHLAAFSDFLQYKYKANKKTMHKYVQYVV